MRKPDKFCVFATGMDAHHLSLHKHRSDTEELSEIYSASERKKGSRAPWTSQDMMSAMLLVKQGMSITKAAQSLNIPRTTLRDRVTGKYIAVIGFFFTNPFI